MVIDHKNTEFSPTQSKMARAGLGLGVRELADAVECSATTIVRFESGGSLHKRTIKAIRETLEEAGATFFTTDNGQDAVAVKRSD